MEKGWFAQFWSHVVEVRHLYKFWWHWSCTLLWRLMCSCGDIHVHTKLCYMYGCTIHRVWKCWKHSWLPDCVVRLVYKSFGTAYPTDSLSASGIGQNMFGIVKLKWFCRLLFSNIARESIAQFWGFFNGQCTCCQYCETQSSKFQGKGQMPTPSPRHETMYFLSVASICLFLYKLMAGNHSSCAYS